MATILVVTCTYGYVHFNSKTDNGHIGPVYILTGSSLKSPTLEKKEFLKSVEWNKSYITLKLGYLSRQPTYGHS